MANDITASDAGFDVPNNRVTLIRMGAGGVLPPQELPLQSKREVAVHIMREVAGMWSQPPERVSTA